MCRSGSPRETVPGRVKVFLSLGSNLGDRRGELDRAVEKLQERGIVIEETSSIYESEPTDKADQPWFLNLVLRAETSLPPDELLRACKDVEREVGRRPGVRFGPRLIDIDILLYGDEVIATQELGIPHPRMHERRFVLVPLLEIEPDAVDPRNGQSFARALQGLDEGKQVVRSASIGF
jgi:2-amino-4-hydroxy-6-hydroxymethyldihydropteridine diphosphokinase